MISLFRSKRSLSDFKPPKPSKAIIFLSELLLPVYLNFVERLSYKFSQNPDRPVDFLKGKKVVIVINHSDRQDPLLVVALAKYMHEEFYCIAAREVFDWSYGILGWVFQRLGCFSVDRGTTDFRSIHTIQKLLTNSQTKFIVFPEGEVTGDDWLVHEINPALMHIFLKAQAEVAKSESSQSIFILPVGVSYKLETDLHKSVNKTLMKVEHHLGINHATSLDLAVRVENAVATLLKKLSKHYEFSLNGNEPLHAQVRALARHICEQASAYCDNEHLVDKQGEQLLHCVRSELAKTVNSKESENLIKRSEKEKSYGELFSDLDRAERLTIVQRVLTQTQSPIRTCRTVDFLESELCGRMTAKGRQSASVYFGSPIDLLPFMQTFQSDKNDAAAQLRESVSHGLQLALDNSHTISGVKRQRVGENLASYLEIS